MNGKEVSEHTLTQEQMILQHLQEFGHITPMVALEEYGCFRLSARIHDIRERLRESGSGDTIETKNITRKNRFGHTMNFAEYVYKPSKGESV